MQKYLLLSDKRMRKKKKKRTGTEKEKKFHEKSTPIKVLTELAFLNFTEKTTTLCFHRYRQTCRSLQNKQFIKLTAYI